METQQVVMCDDDSKGCTLYSPQGWDRHLGVAAADAPEQYNAFLSPLATYHRNAWICGGGAGNYRRIGVIGT